jgi:putative FmdB family regulatory protein|tara:strand:- start:1364 stop:1861 length:498 start_codon:yes stop_codon:yes gene_type:complete
MALLGKVFSTGVVMPIYEFQCDACGLRFEKLFRAVSNTQESPCGSCGEPAHKLVSAAAFQFAHIPVGGPRPQNTGVHSIDHNADLVIGRDAERRWKMAEERKALKDKVAREHHKVGGQAFGMDHVVRDGSAEGGYRTMGKGEREYVNEHRTAAFEIAKASAKPKK